MLIINIHRQKIRLRNIYRRDILGSMSNAVAPPPIVLYYSLFYLILKYSIFHKFTFAVVIIVFLIDFPTSFNSTELVMRFKIKEPQKLAKSYNI